MAGVTRGAGVAVVTRGAGVAGVTRGAGVAGVTRGAGVAVVTRGRRDLLRGKPLDVCGGSTNEPHCARPVIGNISDRAARKLNLTVKIADAQFVHRQHHPNTIGILALQFPVTRAPKPAMQTAAARGVIAPVWSFNRCANIQWPSKTTVTCAVGVARP